MNLKNKSKELKEKLLQISAYSEKSSYEQSQERLSKLCLLYTSLGKTQYVQIHLTIYQPLDVHDS